MDRERTKTLQVRVDAAYAQRLAALAAAMGISQAELLRRATDAILAEAEGQIDALKDRVQEHMRTQLRAHEDKAF